ncbi:HAD-IB family phosphatase [Azospirillum sp. B510]|uniref:HAD-IB family phosphatase n=1 Tax=Azospirillum sp. (strain B510) TaxID=137722 RepID=UPI00068FFA40|nr:HAD-IB family phosphatase [Azospirillum sp. B510]
MHSSISLYIDFDGTISLEDTTDLILQRFADPAWEAVEESWARGEIGSRDCMARQVALLRVTPAEFDSFAAGIGVDPDFPAFMALCHRHGVPVTVLSDGLDRVARGVLRRLGFDVPVLSNRLRWQGDDRWQLEFPHARPGCASAAGNCKCSRFAVSAGRAADGRVAALIGDGRSDFCAAEQADAVFAKGKLARHCQEAGIPHAAFTGFGDLAPLFEEWVERIRPAAVSELRNGLRQRA